MEHTYIKANGQITRCPHFMQSPPLKKGYWWHGTHDRTWIECPMPATQDINDKRLFGYTDSEFMAKQYK
jgi:hypothetical protein